MIKTTTYENGMIYESETTYKNETTINKKELI